MELTTFHQLGIALGLGLLVGLEREWSAQKEVAGIRTFPLITLFGAFAALLAARFGGWVMAAALVSLASVIIVGNLARMRQPEATGGITTEVAALFMFFVGAALIVGFTAPAIATSGGVALLLHWKRPLHDFVRRIGENDFRAVVRLVLVGLVILPALPDRAYGPYEVLNPFRIWLMVVLIVGISLGAYVVSKALGPRRGSLVAGVMGGLISSTATSVGYARTSKGDPTFSSVSATVIVVASTVVFARAIFEIAVVAPGFLTDLAPPLLTMAGVMSLLSIVAFRVGQRELVEGRSPSSPPGMKAALIFGLLYALVIFAVAVTQEHIGDRALYAVAAISGLTDMDAITLSTAELVKANQLQADIGWRLILAGAMANLVFKGAAVAVLGSPDLRRRVTALFGLGIVAGGLLLWLW